MMTRTMTGMLIAVLAITSAAQADFNENFESHTVGSAPDSPWESLWDNVYQNGNYTAGVINTGFGDNTTQVLDLQDAAHWAGPIINLPSDAWYAQGSVTWDMASEPGETAQTRFWWKTTDEGTSSGDKVIHLRSSSTSVWEGWAGSNHFDQRDPVNKAEDVLTNGTWQSWRVDYDFLDGVDGAWQLSIDGTQVLAGALGTDGTASGKVLKTLAWACPSGKGHLIDNIVVAPVVVPEPATGLLLVGGLAFLLRRRA